MLIETLGHRILNGSLAVISPSGSVTTFGEKTADQAAAKVVVRVNSMDYGAEAWALARSISRRSLYEWIAGA